MSQPITILCPGQGAQVVRMGRAWYDASDQARKTIDQADEILGDSLGAPLSELCFNGPVDRLNDTDVCQPGIYAVSVACWRALVEQWGGQPEIVAAAGLSLGEYTALHLAGAFSFEDGLQLVAQRGRFMQDAARASRGSMVALIGADENAAQGVCEEARDGQILVPANLNAPGQIVLSGDADACERAIAVATRRQLRATPLAVAGAFHSALMQPAADKMKKALATVDWSPLKFPVIANVTAQPHSPTDTNSIQARLVEQMTAPVRWAQSCLWLGANSNGAYHELAPGKVLAGLMRRINRDLKVVNHDQP